MDSLDKRAKLVQSLVATCTDFDSTFLSAKITKRALSRPNVPLGGFVTIRSCHPEDPQDLFMAIYVGTVPFMVGPNPVFYVFKLKKLLAGFESWWNPISPGDQHLECDAMKAKYAFTWEDIEQEIGARLDAAIRASKGKKERAS